MKLSTVALVALLAFGTLVVAAPAAQAESEIVVCTQPVAGSFACVDPHTTECHGQLLYRYRFIC